MGLIIKSTAEKKITIQGTEIEVPEIYGRIEFAGRANGVKLEVAVATYASEKAFKEGAGNLFTDVQQVNFSADLQAGENQSVETAHKYAEEVYKSLGYGVKVLI